MTRQLLLVCLLVSVPSCTDSRRAGKAEVFPAGPSAKVIDAYRGKDPYYEPPRNFYVRLALVNDEPVDVWYLVTHDEPPPQEKESRLELDAGHSDTAPFKVDKHCPPQDPPQPGDPRLGLCIWFWIGGLSIHAYHVPARGRVVIPQYNASGSKPEGPTLTVWKVPEIVLLDGTELGGLLREPDADPIPVPPRLILNVQQRWTLRLRPPKQKK